MPRSRPRASKLPMPRCKIDRKLKEGDTIRVGDLSLEVWHTPGHTEGQLSFKLGKLLFSGDNIYKDSCVGVIDAHHGSNIPKFLLSLERIRDDDSEFLLPSHGPVFRRDNRIIQKAIDRLTDYQYMADFGTVHRLLAAAGRMGGATSSRGECRNVRRRNILHGKRRSLRIFRGIPVAVCSVWSTITLFSYSLCALNRVLRGSELVGVIRETAHVRRLAASHVRFSRSPLRARSRTGDRAGESTAGSPSPCA